MFCLFIVIVRIVLMDGPKIKLITNVFSCHCLMTLMRKSLSAQYLVLFLVSGLV